MITVERLEDGEVSPYLTEDVRPGDAFEVRGPIGGYFVWRPDDGGPLFLAAGGSGVVPMRAILRHRRNSMSEVRARLLYSSRTFEDVIYRAELDGEVDGPRSSTRSRARSRPGWTGYARRVDAELLREVAWPAEDGPLAFVCGPTSFVEAVAAGLVELGYATGTHQDRAVRSDGRTLMEALDGNAIGGMLYHVFGGEMTMAEAECGHCGARGPLAECEVYLGGPGVVVRCRVCHKIVMVLVEVRDVMCVDLGGLSSLEPATAGRA